MDDIKGAVELEATSLEYLPDAAGGAGNWGRGACVVGDAYVLFGPTGPRQRP
jgi:hypothetical protein